MEEPLGHHSHHSFVKRKRKDQENQSVSNEHHEKRRSIGNFNSKDKEMNLNLGSSSSCSSHTPREVLRPQDLNRNRSSTPPPLYKNERKLPLPSLNWSNHRNLWDFMCIKDKSLQNDRKDNLFNNHPEVQPIMRAILLDWIIEVCEVYKMQRETYFLSVDYLDRFLSKSRNVEKKQLQLTGITCLFIAAKVEEIYPPKLLEFAYVTDGACSIEDIIQMELYILKTLEWSLSSVTVLTWVNLYLQLCQKSPPFSKASSLIFPIYKTSEFLKVAQLLDLCMLDSHSLQFSYSVLAASSIYISLTHFQSEIFRASGLSYDQMSDCIKWISAFYDTIQTAKGNTISPTKAISNNPMSNGILDATYLQQTHDVTVDMMKEAQQRFSIINAKTPQTSSILLTPPPSNCKQNKCTDGL